MAFQSGDPYCTRFVFRDDRYFLRRGNGNRCECKKPETDHNIYALAVGGGSFKSFYEKTDDSGRVTFVYYPPKMAGYQTEKSVTLKFRDESNSVFIEIYPSTEYTIELTRQEESGGMPVGDFLN